MSAGSPSTMKMGALVCSKAIYRRFLTGNDNSPPHPGPLPRWGEGENLPEVAPNFHP
ncbi:hypothetical protein HYR99_36970 [Candidatus Poribacteria bacterium]|nr:hypothetical protein [Candidatus Poribacteria bacterium]